MNSTKFLLYTVLSILGSVCASMVLTFWLSPLLQDAGIMEGPWFWGEERRLEFSPPVFFVLLGVVLLALWLPGARSWWHEYCADAIACPRCAEKIKRRATVCRYCSASLRHNPSARAESADSPLPLQDSDAPEQTQTPNKSG